MTITISATGEVIRARKPRAKAIKPKLSRAREQRTYPVYREGWTTGDYIAAYHAANSSVMLTTVSYTCK